ncbi:MAG: DoxX family membrane protein [Rhodobacteraceae bacterium]|nr:DoxX family membrane protein [Paracoccaceae bacterium]
MNALLSLYDRVSMMLMRLAPSALPLLARFAFAAVLAGYFWKSARPKMGEGFGGFLHPSDGAYIQIFPKVVEAANYDISQLGLFHWAVVEVGMLAELILPLLLILGLFTRLAALGMIGFTLVQSLTDIYGHDVGSDDLGRWFDAASGALIWDQRTLWVAVFLTLVFAGAGPLSFDRLLAGKRH